MDQHFRAILFLLSTVALATALPLSDLDELLPVEASAQKQLTNGENVCSSKLVGIMFKVANQPL